MKMSPPLTEVLDNPGFRAIADAVRRVTVNAQFQRANKHEHRDVRYDLFPELRRKRELPGNEPLIEALSEFVQSYNSENAGQRETLATSPGKKTWYPPSQVTTVEFASFVALVETLGASIVGAMLCAYGSCREPRESEASEMTGEAEALVEGN